MDAKTPSSPPGVNSNYAQKVETKHNDAPPIENTACVNFKDYPMAVQIAVREHLGAVLRWDKGVLAEVFSSCAK